MVTLPETWNSIVSTCEHRQESFKEIARKARQFDRKNERILENIQGTLLQREGKYDKEMRDTIQKLVDKFMAKQEERVEKVDIKTESPLKQITIH